MSCPNPGIKRRASRRESTGLLKVAGTWVCFADEGLEKEIYENLVHKYPPFGSQFIKHMKENKNTPDLGCRAFQDPAPASGSSLLLLPWACNVLSPADSSSKSQLNLRQTFPIHQSKNSQPSSHQFNKLNVMHPVAPIIFMSATPPHMIPCPPPKKKGTLLHLRLNSWAQNCVSGT